MVIRNASVTGVVALGMSYVTISGNLFALSAEELSILSACIFGWLMRANFGLSLSLAITLLFSGAGGAVQGGIIALGADPIITTLAFGGFFRGLGLGRKPEPEHTARQRRRGMAWHRATARRANSELGVHHSDPDRMVRPATDQVWPSYCCCLARTASLRRPPGCAWVKRRFWA